MLESTNLNLNGNLARMKGHANTTSLHKLIFSCGNEGKKLEYLQNEGGGRR